MHSGEITPEQLSASGISNLKFETIMNALKRIEKAFEEIITYKFLIT